MHAVVTWVFVNFLTLTGKVGVTIKEPYSMHLINCTLFFLILTDLRGLERPMLVELYSQKPNILICHFII